MKSDLRGWSGILNIGPEEYIDLPGNPLLRQLLALSIQIGVAVFEPENPPQEVPLSEEDIACTNGLEPNLLSRYPVGRQN